MVRPALLFSVDAFAGGTVVNSLLSLWLMQRFGLSLAAAGQFFFAAGLLTTASQLAAVPLSRRIGLLNTMVFTHIPSSLFLIAAAFSLADANAGAVAREKRAIADGRADADCLCDGGGDATRAHRRGEPDRRPAKPGCGDQPHACGRLAGDGMGKRATARLRRAEDCL